MTVHSGRHTLVTERALGRRLLAALIRYVCDVDHGVPDRHERVPTLTVHSNDWAYCRTGGDSDHDWRELLVPDSIENLRSIHHHV
jgi:hypothetical protein